MFLLFFKLIHKNCHSVKITVAFFLKPIIRVICSAPLHQLQRTLQGRMSQVSDCTLTGGR